MMNKNNICIHCFGLQGRLKLLIGSSAKCTKCDRIYRVTQWYWSASSLVGGTLFSGVSLYCLFTFDLDLALLSFVVLLAAIGIGALFAPLVQAD